MIELPPWNGQLFRITQGLNQEKQVKYERFHFGKEIDYHT